MIATVTALSSPGLIEAQTAVATLLSNGDVRIGYYGIPSQKYVALWADSLIPPVTWSPLQTNTADSSSEVFFTNTPAGAQRFYRVSGPPPLAYAVENTGAGYPAPALPTFSSLPIIQPLTDPFMWSDGSGRSTNFSDWSRRRAEIKAEIEYYEIGPKPAVDPQKITATFTNSTPTNGTLIVTITETNGQTLTLTCAVALPSGTGPFPAVIGMNSGSGSLPSSIFSSRNIARITFSHNQVTTYNNPQNTNPYYLLYPGFNVDNTGQYSAWAWGVSRIIDGLEKVQNVLPIDLRRLCVTGCSYAGKMALFAGALDERVALTIAQESGGGGVAAWRVSETLGEVEKLGATSHQWFRESMFQFAGANVSKLPMDHHELCAMIMPRALLVLGNPDYVWLADESGYVSSRAAHEVWKTFGIGDRFGFDIVGGHSHCVLAASQNTAVQAFVDRFLLGNTNVNTAAITNAPTYIGVDYRRWFQWWGTGNPVFPTNGNAIAFEAECATVGTNWDIVADAQASNGKYVTVKAGVQSIASAPANNWDWVTIPFTLTNSGNFALFGRLNCPTADDDSFWVRMDGGAWTLLNGVVTSGWQWITLNNYSLSAGSHTLDIGYREDGAKLDKISISDNLSTPQGTGQPAQNICGP